MYVLASSLVRPGDLPRGSLAGRRGRGLSPGSLAPHVLYPKGLPQNRSYLVGEAGAAQRLRGRNDQLVDSVSVPTLAQADNREGHHTIKLLANIEGA